MSVNDHEIHIGDVTWIRLTFKDKRLGTIVDISGASLQQITFRRPDLTTFTVTSQFDSDGTDGQIKFKTRNAGATIDLNQAGTWQVQGYVVTPDGQWHSSTPVIVVEANL